MSNQILTGTPTFIVFDIFDIVEETTVTAKGASETSSVSTRKSGQDWEPAFRPRKGEEMTLSVPAGGQCFVLNVWIKFETGQKK